MPPIILAFPENQTRIKLNSELDHVGPFPIVEACCSFLTSHWAYWGTQKSSDKSCFVIHRKDVNAPNHRSNAKTIAHGGGSQCRLRVRAKVTQNPSSYKLPFKKGRPCPEPPTTGVQKSLVSSISCMKCELSDYTARGFWASDVQRCSKSPALIPKKREYKGAGDPWH